MQANNPRPKTIEQYVIAVNHLRFAFPETYGPGDIITPARKFRILAHTNPTRQRGR